MEKIHKLFFLFMIIALLLSCDDPTVNIDPLDDNDAPVDDNNVPVDDNNVPVDDNNVPVDDNDAPGAGWNLHWSDEFNDGVFDTTKWTREAMEPGTVNKEWQRYTSDSSHSWKKMETWFLNYLMMGQLSQKEIIHPRE